MKDNQKGSGIIELAAEIKTPLTRAQKRLDHWKGILSQRIAGDSFERCGSISITVQEAVGERQGRINSAKAAVRDWETIVEAVRVYTIGMGKQGK